MIHTAVQRISELQPIYVVILNLQASGQGRESISLGKMKHQVSTTFSHPNKPGVRLRGRFILQPQQINFET